MYNIGKSELIRGAFNCPDTAGQKETYASIVTAKLSDQPEIRTLPFVQHAILSGILLSVGGAIILAESMADMTKGVMGANGTFVAAAARVFRGGTVG
jgi:hypothetical protein